MFRAVPSSPITLFPRSLTLLSVKSAIPNFIISSSIILFRSEKILLEKKTVYPPRLI